MDSQEGLGTHQASGNCSGVPHSRSVHSLHFLSMACLVAVSSCWGVRMRIRELCTMLVCLVGHPALTLMLIHHMSLAAPSVCIS